MMKNEQEKSEFLSLVKNSDHQSKMAINKDECN